MTTRLRGARSLTRALRPTPPSFRILLDPGCNGVARLAVLLAATAGVVPATHPAHAQAPEPIAYTLRIPAPNVPVLEVEARFPTGGRDSVELMLPTWSPGFYRVEDYAAKIQAISARGPLGTDLPLRPDSARHNRWTVWTGGAGVVTVTYRLLADQRSVTTNWVGPDLGVLNGPATFITLADTVRRPHEVALTLPATWKLAATGLDPAADSVPNHWRADDYDELMDSPIVAGDLSIHSFDVLGHRFDLVDVGQPATWDGRRAARDLERMVRANDRVWHDLPFHRYVFLNLFRPGGGGLEHRNSTLLTANASRATTPEGYRRWLAFAAHEYVHAFNVKRLRPVELGPFDYAHGPRTPSLWIAEGVTTYLANLALARAGLVTREEFLADLSGQIAELQNQPGRLLQTVEQSSLEVWTNSLSGINPSGTTVSYYVKGAVLGFLLDARIRHETAGARSLDDVMRLAYQRYGGAKGFTPQEFRAVADEVAGADLSDWFRRAVSSTEELDYREALDWYGLRFVAPAAAGAGAGAEPWTLAVRDDATSAQRTHLQSLLSPP